MNESGGWFMIICIVQHYQDRLKGRKYIGIGNG